jgi:hypothetical protein
VLEYRCARALDKPGTLVLDRLAEWMRRGLAGELAAVGGDGRGAGLADALTHAAALLRMDGEQRLRGLANYLLWKGIDRLESLGRLDLCGLALDGWRLFRLKRRGSRNGGITRTIF